MQDRKQRALDAVVKFKSTLTTDERLAAFAAWFAEQEFGWKDTRKEPPTDMMIVLLKDSKLNIVRLGYRTGGGQRAANAFCASVLGANPLIRISDLRPVFATVSGILPQWHSSRCLYLVDPCLSIILSGCSN